MEIKMQSFDEITSFKRRNLCRFIASSFYEGYSVYHVTLTVDDEHLPLGQDKLFSAAKAILRQSNLPFVLFEHCCDSTCQYHLHAILCTLEYPSFSWRFGSTDCRLICSVFTKEEQDLVPQTLFVLLRDDCRVAF